MQWYYAVDGQQHGPFSDEKFVALVEEGTVRPSTPVWNETMTDWTTCRRVSRDLRRIRDAARRRTADEVEVAQDASVSLPDIESQQSEQHYEKSNAPQLTAVDLMARARNSLDGNWGVAVVFTFLFIFITQSFQSLNQLSVLFPRFMGNATALQAKFIMSLITLTVTYLFAGIFQLGVSRFYLDIIRSQPARLVRLFYGFKFWRSALSAYMLMMMYIALWSLLLVIPGIVAAFSYAMTFFVLADNPGMSAVDALRASKRMMQGNRYKLFTLFCAFAGWYLVAFLTCGIGFLWVQPYMFTAIAAFYEEVADPAVAAGDSA